MFKRGEGPLVSILLPTRGRPKWLCEAVDSLHSLAHDKSLVEYIFRIDQDDVDTIKTVENMSRVLPCRTIIAPRGKGYFELNKYVNECAAVARGDWLFIWNDDARMKTQNWDQVLLKLDPTKVNKWAGNDDVCLVAPRVIEREISWEFPILRRKTFQMLGHFSLHISSDSWIYWVLSGVNAAFIVDAIQVSHFVNEIDDLTKKEGRSAINATMEDLATKEMQVLEEQDVDVLREYLAGGGRRIFE